MFRNVARPELEAALLARKHGHWNRAWAERYATEKDGVKRDYDEVIRFLAKSEEKRRGEVAQLRRTRKRIAAAAVAFAVLAVVAAVAGWVARRNADVARKATRDLEEHTNKYAALLSSLSSPVKRWPEIQGSAGKYIHIPAGTFLMGCSLGDTDCNDDENPTHKVTLTRDFYIGETDVTLGAYRRFAQATSRVMPPAPPFTQTDAHPVVRVSWQDAADYCKWDGGARLPTEAEWEYAVRAGRSQARYGNLDEIGWYEQNSLGGTHPVAQLQPNGFGLYDMLGNVWQWTTDWYDEKYYEKSPAQDPPGPGSSEYRSLRGGAWLNPSRFLRVSARFWLRPGGRGRDIGFRCVREVP